MRRTVGPKPKSRVSHQVAPVSSGSALMTTPFSSSSFDSASVSANEGMSVENRRDSRESDPVGG